MNEWDFQPLSELELNLARISDRLFFTLLVSIPKTVFVSHLTTFYKLLRNTFRNLLLVLKSL